MLASLPLISLIILFLILWKPDEDWRNATLSAAMVWGVLVTAFIEILSLFKSLAFQPLLFLWIATVIGLGFIYYRLLKNGKRLLRLPTIPQIPPVLLGLLGGITFIAAIVGLIAIVAPPNNWDSMAYHMSRVVHWIQNRNVSNYPTYYTPQLYHPPWAEFAITHLQILSHGDRFANLIQWFSTIGSAVGVTKIAKELDADLRGQVFAAVVVLTIPMGILQGSSTQNDYVVCFWLVCLVHSVLLTVRGGLNRSNVLKIGTSLGLALFTKTSAYFFSLPFLIWFVFSGFQQKRWKIFPSLLIIGFIVISINMGHYFRNWELFGSPITGGPPELAVEYKMEIHSIPAFISNIIRNIGLQIGTSFRLINAKINGVITVLHRILGIDPSDPRTTIPGGKFGISSPSFNEDTAGNPVHFLMILFTIYLFVLSRELRNRRNLAIYIISVLASFLLFCLLLKWQPYNARHHLSLFVLLSPFIGVVLSNVFQRNLANYLMTILIVLSMPWVFHNQFRPIVASHNIFNTPRIEQYFFQREWLQNPYIDSRNFIKTKECYEIGLYFPDERLWEYPFWILLKENEKQNYRIEHVLAKNISAVKLNVEPHKSFIPCTLIASPVGDSKDGGEKEIVIRNTVYMREWSQPPVSVYVKQ